MCFKSLGQCLYRGLGSEPYRDSDLNMLTYIIKITKIEKEKKYGQKNTIINE